MPGHLQGSLVGVSTSDSFRHTSPIGRSIFLPDFNRARNAMTLRKKHRPSRLKRMPESAIVSDGNGGSARLISTGLLKCDCMSCEAVFFTESAEPVCCPMCKAMALKMRWTRPQTALVPEDEVSFMRFKAKEGSEE